MSAMLDSPMRQAFGHQSRHWLASFACCMHIHLLWVQKFITKGEKGRSRFVILSSLWSINSIHHILQELSLSHITALGFQSFPPLREPSLFTKGGQRSRKIRWCEFDHLLSNTPRFLSPLSDPRYFFHPPSDMSTPKHCKLHVSSIYHNDQITKCQYHWYLDLWTTLNIFSIYRTRKYI